MESTARIFVAGHRGLAGSAIVRKLTALGYTNPLLRTRHQLDLLDRSATRAFFDGERPEYVFVAAAKVGGVLANRDFPADFIAQNLDIQNNIIESALATGVTRLLILGIELHLSEASFSTPKGRILAVRSPGVYESSLRCRKDRRDRHVLGM